MPYQKVAVVSGSNKGIGFAIVRSLCRNYDGVVYLTSRNVKRGEEAINKLRSEKLDANYHQLDICDNESVTRLKDYMVANYGGIDVLINNAGIAYNPTSTAPMAEKAAVTIATNFTGTLRTCNILLPIIKRNGRVVNLSTYLAKLALDQYSEELQAVFRSKTIVEKELVQEMDEIVKNAAKGKYENTGISMFAYITSKVSIIVMTQIQARSLQAQGRSDILINSCCPGWVHTEMGGPQAPKTPDEGAVTPVYLALLPEGETEPNGQLVSEKNVVEW